jgi:peptidoglycan/LPS O-acetylase OafA/YrhL
MPKLPLRFDSLDLLRGLAALLVLAGHARSYVFQSFFDLQQSGAPVSTLIRMFYFATGLGNQAVIIFFALSGFLVGGKALDDMLRQHFCWTRYLLRRLTRLWIVIVPALALTLVLDKIGSSLTLGIGYDGRYYDLYSSGLRGPEGVNHSFATLLGNLAFLQTILVPTFGSNGPMWSLANEFWYYIVFPLAAWLCLGQVHAMGKTVAIAILFALSILLPAWLLEGGVIWVAGASAAWCSRLPVLSGHLRALPVRIFALVLLLAALLVSKSSAFFGNLGLGITVALTLPVIAHLPNPGGPLTGIARASSKMSYTLYLTHFPLLTLIAFTGFTPMRWPPNMIATGIYTALIFAAIIWAGIMWWCFERNTDRVYLILTKMLPLPEIANRASVLPPERSVAARDFRELR